MSISSLNVLKMRDKVSQSSSKVGGFIHGLSKKLASRRYVRYSLLVGNIILLGGIAFFVLTSSDEANKPVSSAVVESSSSDSPTNPLDQLTSADIAVNLARMTNLPEALPIVNQADSANTELSVSAATSSVVAKPQVVITSLKSRKDIRNYTVAAGDTVTNIAARFNVTSDSVRWSNGLTGDTVNAGTKLAIPPVNGLVYIVKAGDTPDTLAQKYKANKDQIVVYNDAEVAGLKVGDQILIPGGQQPAPVYSAYSSTAYGFAWGTSAIYGYNGYDYGYCTWYVANKRTEIGRPLPANLGNAYTWDDRAGLAGYGVDHNPAAGAAIVTDTYRNPGHVAYVEAVNEDGSVWVSEMNSHGQKSMTDSTPAGGWGRIDFKLISASSARSYNYIH